MHPPLRTLGAALIAAAAASTPAIANQALPGHLPPILASSSRIAAVEAGKSLSLALTLPPRDPQGLDDLLGHLYTPGDPQYGKYLTPDEFTNRFGPTAADYNAVAAYARAEGLTITSTHANRLVLEVAGPAAAAEKAFGVHLSYYQSPTGRLFFSPDAEPAVPSAIAAKLSGIIGLDNAAVRQTHIHVPAPGSQPRQVGTGPGSGLSPANIKSVYNLTSAPTGTGQVLGLFELANYKATDITKYESYFGLRQVPLKNVLVSSRISNSGSDEVTLDIELQAALAPGASEIVVYEGANTDAGVISTYNRIATDNLAKSVSTSWGLDEPQSTSSDLTSEYNIFAQMASQGQSIFAAAGDSGAYDDPNSSSVAVDDPASQPYVVGCGGTTLAVNSGVTFKSETTWNDFSGAGGGGVSQVWSIPSWQVNANPNDDQVSTKLRNVPDVALDASPYSGYSICYQGKWYIFGGTSCAAPLWSAFTALVNQQRVSAGKSTIGFANPALYSIGKSTSFANDFHDVKDNSNNLFYYAVTGYDNATGWGSFNGANLLSALTSY